MRSRAGAVGVLVQISFRNLFASKAKTFIVGGIIADLLTAGSAAATAPDRAGVTGVPQRPPAASRTLAFGTPGGSCPGSPADSIRPQYAEKPNVRRICGQ